MTPQEAKEIQEIKSRAESNTHQIEELKASVHHLEDKQDAIYKMSENLSLMAQSLKNVEEDVSDVKQNQKELSNKVSTLEGAMKAGASLSVLASCFLFTLVAGYRPRR